MTQFYDATGEMKPNQQFGFWVRKDEYQRDLAEHAEKFSKQQGKAEGGFFDELDRLEQANKELHAKIKELENK